MAAPRFADHVYRLFHLDKDFHVSTVFFLFVESSFRAQAKFPASNLNWRCHCDFCLREQSRDDFLHRKRRLERSVGRRGRGGEKRASIATRRHPRRSKQHGAHERMADEVYRELNRGKH